MILGTSKIWSKYGPVDLLTITKMLQNIQEKYGTVLDKYYLCQSGTQKNVFFLMYVLGTISGFRLFEMFCENVSTY